MKQSYASICLLGLSLALILCGTWCSPISRRAIEEAEFAESQQLQPARCREPRPRSTSLCPEELRVRRYFLHEMKGCKRFNICPEDAAVHDNKTEFGEGNFFLNFENCQAECMQHITCPELTTGENMVVVSDNLVNGVEGWGRRVVYECVSGYSLSDNSGRAARICQRNGTWSNMAPVCLKQCQAPPTVPRAYIAPSKDLHSQGSAVHYTCQVGYKLEGSSQLTCSTNGEWSGPAPTCVCEVASASTDACPSCPELSPIEHGHISAPNRSLFAEARYTCDQGFILVGSKNRRCEESGKWSSEEPICWKLSVVKEHNNMAEDITNKTVSVSAAAENIRFMAVSSTPNPFPYLIPAWEFQDGQKPLVRSVQQIGLDLEFSTILDSREQEGTYSISFGNYSVHFQLQVQDAPEMITPPTVFIHPRAPSTEVLPGAKVILRCGLMGCPVPNITWYHNGEVVVFNDRVRRMESRSHAAVAGQLDISSVQPSDSGTYYCSGSNAADTTNSGTTELKVVGSARRRRSAKQLETDTDSYPCSTDKNEVIVIGQLRREQQHRQLRRADSKLMTEYRVQVGRFLQGSDKLTSRRLRVVVLDSESADSGLSDNVDYIIRGTIVDQTIFVSRQNVQRHSQKLEQQINSC